ncbi:MAG: 3-isopropylmalate dehydratase, partial [Comamonadaceae bacterium]
LDESAPAVLAPGGRVLRCDPVPDFLLAMVRAGGLFRLLQQRHAPTP